MKGAPGTPPTGRRRRWGSAPLPLHPGQGHGDHGYLCPPVTVTGLGGSTRQLRCRWIWGRIPVPRHSRQGHHQPIQEEQRPEEEREADSGDHQRYEDRIVHSSRLQMPQRQGHGSGPGQHLELASIQGGLQLGPLEEEQQLLLQIVRIRLGHAARTLGQV